MRIDSPVSPRDNEQVQAQWRRDKPNSKCCNHHDAELDFVHADIVGKRFQDRRQDHDVWRGLHDTARRDQDQHHHDNQYVWFFTDGRCGGNKPLWNAKDCQRLSQWQREGDNRQDHTVDLC